VLFCVPLYKFLHNLLNVLVLIANKMGVQKIFGAIARQRPNKHISVRTYWHSKKGYSFLSLSLSLLRIAI
jgi:hypothetical protein